MEFSHTPGKMSDYSFYDAMWHSRLAQHLQAASDKYVQECWAVDSIEKEIAGEDDGISVRVFPCKTLRCIGDWYSGDLLRALKAASRLFRGHFSPKSDRCKAPLTLPNTLEPH